MYAGASLIFFLTSVTGDADIYISTNNTRPNFATATWWGRNYGSDVIDIFASDPRACRSPCNYYIGVTADSYSGNSTYVQGAMVFIPSAVEVLTVVAIAATHCSCQTTVASRQHCSMAARRSVFLSHCCVCARACCYRARTWHAGRFLADWSDNAVFFHGIANGERFPRIRESIYGRPGCVCLRRGLLECLPSWWHVDRSFGGLFRSVYRNGWIARRPKSLRLRVSERLRVYGRHHSECFRCCVR